MKICDGYIRVSQTNGREGERFISPLSQREAIDGYMRSRDLVPGRWFEELDESGARADRPLFLEAIRRQQAGEAQVLCVAKLDRFGRSLLDGLGAIEQVTQAGGSVVSVADDLDFSTPTGRLLLTVMMGLAQHEWERTRNTWKEAQDRAIARGVFLLELAPLGYRRTRSGRLAVDAKAAPLVQEVFRRRLEGATPTQLASWLTEQGIPTPRGGRHWSYSSVKTIINRREYLGEVSRAGAVNARAHRPLIDAATWHAAQLPVKAKGGRRPTAEALLQGLLRCSSCSRLLHVKTDEQQRLVYQCPRVDSAGRCPKPVAIFDSVAEPYLQAVLWDQVKGSRRRHQAKLRHAEERAQRASAAVATYRDHPSLLHTLGADRFGAGLDKRCQHEAKAQRALANARAALDAAAPGADELRTAWPSMDIPARRKLLEAHVGCAFVFPARTTDRIWAIPAGEEPQGLPRRNARLMSPLRSFQPRADHARALPAAGSLDWSQAKVTRRLGPFMRGREEWPRFQELQLAGLGLAYANARRHHTLAWWADHFEVEAPLLYRPMPLWTYERLDGVLREALAAHEGWPSQREFARMGLGEARKAVQIHGGAHHWAGRLGLAMDKRQRSNRMRWSRKEMLEAVREISTGEQHFPACKDFKAAGMNGLYATICRLGLRTQLAEELGLSLDPGKHYRRPDRWTDERVADELERMLAGRSRYPIQPEWKAAGLGGLHQKLSKQPGGHKAIAARHRLKMSTGGAGARGYARSDYE